MYRKQNPPPPLHHCAMCATIYEKEGRMFVHGNDHPGQQSTPYNSSSERRLIFKGSPIPSTWWINQNIGRDLSFLIKISDFCDMARNEATSATKHLLVRINRLLLQG